MIFYEFLQVVWSVVAIAASSLLKVIDATVVLHTLYSA